MFETRRFIEAKIPELAVEVRVKIRYCSAVSVNNPRIFDSRSTKLSGFMA
jgi:hypothetical protein